MRVAIFFDGNNYYRALRDFDQGLEFDLGRFAAWITRRVGGDDARFVGAYYYTGVLEDPSGGSDSLRSFLDVLETRDGFFVRREPRVRRVSVCRSCGEPNEYTSEQRVDTRLVAEMIQLAAVDGFDVAVLLSGDGDLVPAVQAAAALGKQAYAALWPGQRMARELRAHSFGVVDLGEGVPEFSTGRRRPGVPAPQFGAGVGGRASREGEDDPEVASEGEPASIQQGVLEVLREADEKLPHVTRWYFLNQWRGTNLPMDAGVRERVLDNLLAAGLAEQYEVTDGKGHPTWAIRVVAAAAEQLPG